MPVAFGIRRAIRRALDPQNLMNPGRVLRVSCSAWHAQTLA